MITTLDYNQDGFRDICIILVKVTKNILHVFHGKLL